MLLKAVISVLNRNKSSLLYLNDLGTAILKVLARDFNAQSTKPLKYKNMHVAMWISD